MKIAAKNAKDREEKEKNLAGAYPKRYARGVNW